MGGEFVDACGSAVGMRRENGRDRIGALADCQYGVVGRTQLLTLGLSSSAIDRRIRAGLLVTLHRGVYAVGHRRLTQDGFWLAAVLATGPGAALSHRDAAALHGLGRWTTGPVEVTTPGHAIGEPGVRAYERRRLETADVTVVAAIPVTTVARTLVDLARALLRGVLAEHATRPLEEQRTPAARLPGPALHPRRRRPPASACRRHDPRRFVVGWRR